jgi:hypothetical protein
MVVGAGGIVVHSNNIQEHRLQVVYDYYLET